MPHGRFGQVTGLSAWVVDIKRCQQMEIKANSLLLTPVHGLPLTLVPAAPPPPGHSS